MLRVDITHEFGRFRLAAKFQADAGVTALFGPSGAGKSTILKAIAGLFEPDQGTIFWSEIPFLEHGRSLPANQRRLGLVFQDARLFPHMNVSQNLDYGARFAREPGVVKRNELIELLDLGDLLKRHTRTLSGGEAQRVAIGRALLSAPRMLLLDEPLASLDAARKDSILPYLERIKTEAKLPMLYVSHSMEEVARLADRLVLIKEGRIRHQGSLFDVLGNPEAAPLVGVREAGAILSAQVEAHGEDGISTLRLAAGKLELPGITSKPGEMVRLRILASDVIIATRKPVGLSAMNRLPAIITQVYEGGGPGAIVALDAQGDRLLARVTARTVARLRLREGMPCYAILKAMSVAPAAISRGAEMAAIAKPEPRPRVRIIDPLSLGKTLRPNASPDDFDYK